jgi:hypothetical protein
VNSSGSAACTQPYKTFLPSFKMLQRAIHMTASDTDGATLSTHEAGDSCVDLESPGQGLKMLSQLHPKRQCAPHGTIKPVGNALSPPERCVEAGTSSVKSPARRSVFMPGQFPGGFSALSEPRGIRRGSLASASACNMQFFD